MNWIALFRGLNVGGKNVLRMKDLARLLEDLGLHGARTYIQSGNAVFRSGARASSRLTAKIRAAILREYGIETEVILLSERELEQALELNPFPDAKNDPSKLHLFFLASEPTNPDLDWARLLRGAREQFALVGNVFYLHAPEGIGKSKLAARVEKLVGTAATARNLRTVGKLLEMARDIG